MNNKIFKILIFILCLSGILFAQRKELNVGYIRWLVTESLDEGESGVGYQETPLSFWDGYIEGRQASKAFVMTCVNWTDANDELHTIKATSHGQWDSDPQNIIMAVPDANGLTVRRVYRYQPPKISVNGVPVQDFFPVNESDAVDPSALPGTVDAMVSSYVNSDMGVSIRCNVYALSQEHHDKYLIREYTFINTGNIDLDDTIELPNQTIEAFYWGKQLRPSDSYSNRPWLTTTGQMPGEDLRVMYVYPDRNPEATHDALGSPNVGGSYNLQFVYAWGEAVIFASESPANFNTDDINQPSSTAYIDADFTGFTDPSQELGDERVQLLREIMVNGGANIPGVNWPEMAGTKPGHHGIPPDQRGVKHSGELEDLQGYIPTISFGCGPYDLQFGDSIRIVTAELVGSMSPEKNWEVSRSWLDGTISWGDDVIGGSTDILPEPYQLFPELYAEDEIASEQANWAKDNWIMSCRDSAIAMAEAAKWAYDNNFNVPQAPQAPDLAVQSSAAGITLNWGADYSAPDDLAGFRVYRSLGNWYAAVPYGETQFLGARELVYTAGPDERTWTDTEAIRGVAYYYSVTAFDDGVSNGTDFNGPAGPLESNFVLNTTTFASNKLKAGASTLDSIRVVPNPFNLAASEIQYPGETNKIKFLNVPSKCTIRIFSESGDLVQTIDHDGSGDASWGINDDTFMVTNSQQVVVSGLYVAQIETPEGQSKLVKFVIVR
jgi:hypothetical protein